MEKKMPQLEAGMIIETKLCGKTVLYIYVNDEVLLDLCDPDGWDGLKSVENSENYCGVQRIYQVYGSRAYGRYNTDKKLIWEKNVKSQTEIQIEELEKTIQDAQDQLKSIKKSI